METIKQKVDHVGSSYQTRFHICHWPGCEVEVPPALWGCRKHWFMLPKEIRLKIWKEYSSGQEERQRHNFSEAQNWIREHYP